MQAPHGRGQHFLLLSSCVLLLIYCRSPRLASTEARYIPLQHYHPSRAELSRIAGYGEEALSSVLVTGTVVCDVWSDGETEFRASYVQGAKVTVRCSAELVGTKKNFILTADRKTDEYGDFTIQVPSRLHATPSMERACNVVAVRAPGTSPCRGASFIRSSRSTALKLSWVGDGTRVYNAGVLRLISITTTTSAAAAAAQRRRPRVQKRIVR